MNDNDFLNFFNQTIAKGEPSSKRTDEDELDLLWDEYISYVNELKSEGYKVMRNDAGKHKIIKK